MGANSMGASTKPFRKRWQPSVHWGRLHGGGQPEEIWPIDDLKDHVLWPGPCWCGATEDAEGVVMHDSMDQRERYESGELRLH